jgi:hypothetical protein
MVVGALTATSEAEGRSGERGATRTATERHQGEEEREAELTVSLQVCQSVRGGGLTERICGGECR